MLVNCIAIRRVRKNIIKKISLIPIITFIHDTHAHGRFWSEYIIVRTRLVTWSDQCHNDGKLVLRLLLPIYSLNIV